MFTTVHTRVGSPRSTHRARPSATAERKASAPPAAVIAASEALFGQGELAALDAVTLRHALEELPNATVAAGTNVVQALVETGLVSSLSEGRRAIAQGGVSLDGAKVTGDDAAVTGTLPGGVSVLRRGKKTLAGLFLS